MQVFLAYAGLHLHNRQAGHVTCVGEIFNRRTRMGAFTWEQKWTKEVSRFGAFSRDPLGDQFVYYVHFLHLVISLRFNVPGLDYTLPVYHLEFIIIIVFHIFTCKGILPGNHGGNKQRANAGISEIVLISPPGSGMTLFHTPLPYAFHVACFCKYYFAGN